MDNKEQVTKALETYNRMRNFGYPTGDALMSALTVNPHVSRHALKGAISTQESTASTQ